MGWDISINYTIASGKLNLAISGITLLTFMCIHLFQFRFGETQPFKLCPPPYLMNIGTIFHLRLNLFWVDDPGCTTAEVRDIIWNRAAGCTVAKCAFVHQCAR